MASSTDFETMCRVIFGVKSRKLEGCLKIFAEPFPSDQFFVKAIWTRSLVGNTAGVANPSGVSLDISGVVAWFQRLSASPWSVWNCENRSFLPLVSWLNCILLNCNTFSLLSPDDVISPTRRKAVKATRSIPVNTTLWKETVEQNWSASANLPSNVVLNLASCHPF